MEYWAPKSALVIVAHPDDIEFGCAGTVIRWVADGASVTYALLTNGAAGSSDPAMTRERLAELRAAEQRAAAKVAGVGRVELLGYEDGELEATLELREELVRLIRRVRPEVVVTTNPATRYAGDFYVNHPDHIAAGEATLAAIIPGSDTRLAYPHLLDEGLEPVKLTAVWMIQSTDPNLVVDISAVMDTKLESLRCHTSQMADDPTPFVLGLARMMAAGRPYEYGEGFKVIRFGRLTEGNLETLVPLEDG
jgi:LmbE family N-acetylglucosaminyl deacetylase